MFQRVVAKAARDKLSVPATMRRIPRRNYSRTVREVKLSVRSSHRHLRSSTMIQHRANE
jgi:hypothetical protein